MDSKSIGMFLIGLGFGMFLPPLPAPADVLNPYLPFLFLILAIVLLVKN